VYSKSVRSTFNLSILLLLFSSCVLTAEESLITEEDSLNLICEVKGKLIEDSANMRIYINGGRDEGWVEPPNKNKRFNFKKITVTDREIFLVWKIGLVDKCRISIDRRDGEVVNKCPLWVFRGHCEKNLKENRNTLKF